MKPPSIPLIIAALGLLGLAQGCVTPQLKTYTLHVEVEPVDALVTLHNQRTGESLPSQTENQRTGFLIHASERDVRIGSLPFLLTAEAPGYRDYSTTLYGSYLTRSIPVRVSMWPTEETRQAQVEKERRDYIEANPHLAPRIKEAILLGSIVVGMSEEDVRISWGKPSRVNISEGVGAQIITWVYVRDRRRYRSDHLYFNNGVLVRWNLDR